MSVLQIFTLPDIDYYTKDHLLRRKSRELSSDELGSKWFKQFISDLFETLYSVPAGTGIAAPQVGFSIRVVAIDINMDGQEPILLINPFYVPDGEETISSKETCLSIPLYAGEVTRYSWVSIKALDLHGRPVEFVAEGFLSIVLQHEIDHLDGILYIDVMDNTSAPEKSMSYPAELAETALKNLNGD